MHPFSPAYKTWVTFFLNIWEDLHKLWSHHRSHHRLTTHFSFFSPPCLIFQTGLDPSLIKLVQSVPLWVLFCRRKLDNSSIAKVITQVFPGLIIVWFLIYIFLFFKCVSLSFWSSSKCYGHGQGPEQTWRSLSLVRVIGLTHGWENCSRGFRSLKHKELCVLCCDGN